MKLDDFRTLIVAIDTSTDMLACSVAWWTPEVFFDDTPSRACVEVLASRDHLCRRHANIELVDTVKTALSDAGKTIEDVGGFLVGRGARFVHGGCALASRRQRVSPVARMCR